MRLRCRCRQYERQRAEAEPVFLGQSMDLVMTLNPAMEDLRLTQTKARASLEQSKKDWERRQEMLDMILPVTVVGRCGARVPSGRTLSR